MASERGALDLSNRHDRTSVDSYSIGQSMAIKTPNTEQHPSHDAKPTGTLFSQTITTEEFSVRIDSPDGPNNGSQESVCESIAVARQFAWPTTSVCIIILTLLALSYTLYFAKPVMLPIAGAFLLNLLFSPLVKFLNRQRIPNVVGTLAVMGTAIGIVAFALSFTAEPAQSWMAEKDKNLEILQTKLNSLREPVAGLIEVSEQIDNISSGEVPDSDSDDVAQAPGDQHVELSSISESKPKSKSKSKPKSVVPVTVSQPSISSRIFSSTGDALIGISLMLVLLFYLLASGDRGLEKLVEIMPTFKNKRRVVQLTHAIEKSISQYLLTTTAINASLGIVIGTGMWAMGMPNPILWGVVAMLLNFLPFVGAFIGASVVFFVAVISFDSLGYATIAPAIYLAANVVEANFITPVLIGRSVSLHPVWLMVFFVIVSWVWGVGGAIVAVPLLAVIKITCDHVEPLMPIGIFLGR